MNGRNEKEREREREVIIVQSAYSWPVGQVKYHLTLDTYHDWLIRLQ